MEGLNYGGAVGGFQSSLYERGMVMAYCIAIVLIFLKVFLMVTIGILRLFSSIFIDGMWVIARAPAVMTMSGSIFHPLEAILSISGLYLLFFASIVYGENLSLQ
jgi:hypothetical protein